MSEFRIPLEGGQVLVLTYTIEDGVESVEAIDPTSLGTQILRSLGINMGSQANVATRTDRYGIKRPLLPPEPTADEWLERSSREALRKL